MISNILSKSIDFVKEHSPELLISAGVVGMATSTVLAVKATPKALNKIEDKKADLGVTYLTRKEIIETTWKDYVPAAGLSAVSAACIILGTTKNVKRNTALATVYALSENTLREYKNKTKEIVGEEKAREIDSEVNKSVARERQKPIIIQNNESEYVTHTGDGDTLIYDMFSGRYFRSSVTAVERAVNLINKRLFNDYLMTVNDFYSEINIPQIGAGNLIGWKTDKDMMEISFDSDIDKYGNPYLILNYVNKPVPLYVSHGDW